MVPKHSHSHVIDIRMKIDCAQNEVSESPFGPLVSDSGTDMATTSNIEMASSKELMAYDDVPLSEALTPDPQYERDFRVDDNKFAFSPGQLNKLLNPKSLAAFHALGGIRGLERGLQTDLDAGLSMDEGEISEYVTYENARKYAISEEVGQRRHLINPESANGLPFARFSDRTRIFGYNLLPEPRKKGFLKLLWMAYNDKIIILLTIAAIVSLSLGIYEALSGQSQVDWIEGLAVCVAIIIVVSATAGNDWQKERQFAKLNRRVWHLPLFSLHSLLT
jgi:Ca2+-transporting ATPase